MDYRALGDRLRSEARAVDERRLVVLAGDREAGYEAAGAVLDGAAIDREATTLLGPTDRLGCERIDLARASDLLGTTRDAIILDLHDELRPNAVGATVGAVDGGGLYVLLVPPLSSWPNRRDGFDARIAAPPFEDGDVTGLFRRRFVATLRRGRGIAIADVDAGELLQAGTVDPDPVLAGEASDVVPPDGVFPEAAYERCRTDDQHDALAALEALDSPGTAAVLRADRGRGKSSAAGLAAGALALDGADVLVTAPAFRNAREVLARARDLVDDVEGTDSGDSGDGQSVATAPGGQVRFRSPDGAVADLSSSAPDAVVVDEAAALPVRRLESLLAADRIVFATTTYGYEGTGRGFGVRFRDRLDAADHEVVDVRPTEPIRHAPGDPVETWAFDALLLDATPVPGLAIDDTTPDAVTYRRLDPDGLVDDEALLREAFGLLVLAHYRTEPADLARLLDAPNLALRALTVDGHVVSVAMLAREGGLGPATRTAAFDGERIRGNMLPDVLLSQLRDEDAGRPVGARVVRIATHPAVRDRGLGAALLDRIRGEAIDGLPEWVDAPTPGDVEDSDGLDWVGVGYGATPRLLRFWGASGYRTIHLSTTRNDTSGEYSALMLDPLTPAGEALAARTTRRFARRIGAVCSGPLADIDPDVVRGALAATDADAIDWSSTADSSDALDWPALTDWEWTVVASAAYGPGMADVAPGPFRRLAVRWLLDRSPPETDVDPSPETNAESPANVPEEHLSDRQERLLVRAAIQGRPWSAVADDLGFPSAGACMRAFGDAFEPIVDRYGSQRALEIRGRYADSGERSETVSDASSNTRRGDH